MIVSNGEVSVKARLGKLPESAMYAINATNTDQRYLGLYLSIVRTLKEYKHPIPVDYLARLYSRSKAEIEPYLNSLEEKGLIARHKEDSEIYVGLS